MPEATWRGYDQQALDAQYVARGAVPGFQLYVDRWTAESAATRRDLTCRIDVAYGPSAAETLNIFPAARSAAPINIFFHGGYWRSMDKSVFDFVARGFVPHGATAIVANYALCPHVDMDELIRQCRAAIAWVYENAATFGGDSARIFVSGHSAGGHIAGMALATDWPGFAGTPPDTVKGATGISGLYELETLRRTFLNVDLRLSPEQTERLSPLYRLPAQGAPFIAAVGAQETVEFLRHTREYANAWKARGWPGTHLELPGHHHYSVLDALTDERHALNRAVLRQMGVI